MAGEVRAALGPVQAGAGDRAAPGRGEVQALGGEPGAALGGGRQIAVAVEQAAFGHGVGEGDADPAREMVVTGTAPGQAASGADRAQPHRPLAAGGRPGGQLLDQAGGTGTGEPHVAVAALPFLGEHAARDQPVQVLARGGGGDAGVAGEFPGGPGAAVQKGQAHGGPGLVGEQGGQGGHPPGGGAGGHRIGSHGSRMPCPEFGASRKVAAGPRRAGSVRSYSSK